MPLTDNMDFSMLFLFKLRFILLSVHHVNDYLLYTAPDRNVVIPGWNRSCRNTGPGRQTAGRGSEGP